MANNEPSPAGYVGHYTSILHTACQARQMLSGNKNDNVKPDPKTIAAVDAAIRAVAGAVVANVEKASAKASN